MSDDFEIEKVEEGSWKDLFSGEWERKNRPFQYFINYKVFKDKKFFGYFPYHVIFEFPEFLWNRLDDLLKEVKWAYQRVYRGWDDRAVWSVDAWLDDIMPDILVKLKEEKWGTPSDYFPNVENITEEEERKASELWNKDLDKMIVGFLCSRRLRDLDYNWKDKEEEAVIRKLFEEGMGLFVKHYHSLWD